MRRPDAFALSDILACNDRVHRALSGDTCDGQRERTIPARRVEDILAAKQLAPAGQHLAKACGDRPGVQALTCTDVPARREKIGTLGDTEARAGARADKRAPGLVRHDDRPGRVEQTDFARQRIEGAQNEAARALQRGLRLGQQNGAAGRGMNAGVALPRFESLKLGGPFDEPADPVLECGLCLQVGRVPRGRLGIHACNPSAANTLPVSLRLPMTFEAGPGDTLARLGVTTTPSANARSGCSQTSTISSL